MLTRVDVTNAAGLTLQLPLVDASGGYIVADLSGLGPVKANITASSYAQIDGARPQSARRDTRNITGRIELYPDYALTNVRNLRLNLYKYLSPKTLVTMGFNFDGVLYANIKGQVESLEPVLFTQNPELALSVICFDPDFYSPNVMSLGGVTVTGTTTNDISYNGTSEAGITLTLSLSAGLTGGFSIYSTGPDSSVQQLHVTETFLSGDIITVSTVPGNKYIQLNRSGVLSSLLYALDPTSDWITLEEGVNSFRVLAAVAGQPYSVEFTEKYGGL